MFLGENAAIRISRWFVAKKSSEITAIVRELHSTILQNFKNKIEQDKFNFPEEAQALKLQEFLNKINNFSQNTTALSNSLEDQLIKQVINDTIGQKIKNTVFSGESGGLAMEQKVTDVLNSILNNLKNNFGVHFNQNLSNSINLNNTKSQFALNIGQAKGLQQIVSDIGMNHMQNVVTTVRDNFKLQQSHSDHSLWQYISTRSELRVVDLKADTAIIKYQFQPTTTPLFNELLEALNGATFSIKAYETVEDISKIMFGRYGGNQGSISLGKTQATNSILPYFTGSQGQQIISKYIGFKQLPTTVLISVYIAAMHLGNLQLDVRRQLEQLSWISDLMGTGQETYAPRYNLSWVDTLIKNQGGVKFFIQIDPNTGAVIVRSMRSLVYQKILDEFEGSQTTHFRSKTFINVLRMNEDLNINYTVKY